MKHQRLLMHSFVLGSILFAASVGSGGCGSETGSLIPDDEANGANGSDASTGGGFPSNGDGAASGGDTGTGSGKNSCVAPSSVTVTPGTTAKNVTPGTSFTVPFKAMADGKDISSQVQFTSSDTNVGTFSGSTFSWGGKFGGALTIKAMYCGVVGSATLNLKLIAPTFKAGPGADTLPPLFASAPASANSSCKPTLKYPPDQVLLPPNTNVIEVHFLKGGNDKFEISFTNPVTDVRIYTTCTAAPLAGGEPDVGNGAPSPGTTGGCLFELNQAEWDYIANTNREGLPLDVTVRGLGCDGGNVSGSATRQISFARQDVIGTIYYWASIRLSSTNENSGGVYRYDYGRRGQTAEAVLTPLADANGNGGNSNGLCVGCHLVDREGRKMVFDFDDNDDDDEYGDMWTNIWDIPSKTSASQIRKGAANAFSAGFSSWNRSAAKFLKSDGWGNGKAGENPTTFDGPRGTFHVVTNLAQPSAKTQPVLASLRGTTPDISPDDTSVVFAAAADRGEAQGASSTSAGFFGSSAHANVAPDGLTDEYFSGAGLYVASWNSATGAMGAPTAIFAAAQTSQTNPPNYYYPAYSPDGSLIVFNYAASGANFHNATARVQLVTASGGVAADQKNANETQPVENAGLLTNSWVRWAPFVQDYKGKRLAWVTFSSTRSYGLRIVNDTMIDCYPTESPSKTIYPEFTAAANANKCARAQLWMTAIDLDTGKVAAGGDVSHPAFWLPFQDRTTQNHLGQWTQKNFKGTCTGDGGACPNGYVCDNGACAAIPPTNTTPPAPAQCTQNVQCPTGSCCNSGTCGACSGSSATPVCNTCLDCPSQACKDGKCAGCTTSADCCAPLSCVNGACVPSSVK